MLLHVRLSLCVEYINAISKGRQALALMFVLMGADLLFLRHCQLGQCKMGSEGVKQGGGVEGFNIFRQRASRVPALTLLVCMESYPSILLYSWV